jgi:hypothetical protein
MVPPPLPTEPEEVEPPPPTEVKPPLPEEVKPPRRNVVLQPVAAVRAPPLSTEEAFWSTKLFLKAFEKLRKVAIHLGV